MISKMECASTSAVQRKLTALKAIIEDPATSEHERANARTLMTRLEKQIPTEGAPPGPVAKVMFEMGRSARNVIEETYQKGDLTNHAFRAGRIVGKLFKR
jgi:hypothetical protein